MLRTDGIGEALLTIDGLTLRKVVEEIDQEASNQRLRQVYMVQPGRFYLVFSDSSLFVSLVASQVYISLHRKEEPSLEVPPAFVMLLRKHLRNALLKTVTQLQGDRIVLLEFEGLSEIGDLRLLTLSIELMGHNSNMILYDQQKVILDSYHRTINEKRSLVPGVEYIPFLQKGLAFDNDWEPQLEKWLHTICDANPDQPQNLSTLIPRFFQGFGHYHVKEVLTRSAFDEPFISHGKGRPEDIQRLLSALKEMKREFLEGDQLYLYSDHTVPKTASPFGMLSLVDLGWNTDKVEPHTAINRLFAGSTQNAQWKSQKQGMERRLNKSIQKAETLLENLNKDLEPAKSYSEIQHQAQMVVTNLYRVNPASKQSSMEVSDWQTAKTMTIQLDERLTISENAQKWFRQSAKMKRRIHFLKTKIQESEEWAYYLYQIQQSLNQVESHEELVEIEEEMRAQGLLPKKKTPKKGAPKKAKIPSPQSPRIYELDGFQVFVGRNNTQNDRITREASPKDLWLHTQQIPGSHVVISHAGKEIPSSVILKAARIAAFYSKAKLSSKVPVDYTIIQNVTKPKGAKPGLAIYKHFHTLVVDPYLPDEKD